MTKFFGKPYIKIIDLELVMIKQLTTMLQIQQNLGAELPLIVTISLHGVADYFLEITNLDYLSMLEFIDRNDLLLSEELVENFDREPAQILKPSFDALYNASGLPSSLEYDENGNWKSQRNY